MKKILFGLFAGLGTILLAAMVFGQTNLTVIRHSDNTIWAMTCDGTSNCSAWTQIPGGFGSQPTLTWDPTINKYILMGIGNNGMSIWRGTFNADGSWNSDWTQIAGGSPSPVALAGSISWEMVWQGSWSSLETYQRNDVVNYGGSSYISLVSNNTAVPTDTQGWLMLAEKGDQGLQGSQGPAGPTGLQGPAGAQGPQGAQGPKGDTGTTGAAGPIGPAGPVGLAGATGAAGPAGPVGPLGATGAAGPAGPVGPAGPMGPRGPAGIQGPPGVANGISSVVHGSLQLDGSFTGTGFTVSPRSYWWSGSDQTYGNSYLITFLNPPFPGIPTSCTATYTTSNYLVGISPHIPIAIQYCSSDMSPSICDGPGAWFIMRTSDPCLGCTGPIPFTFICVF